jgi:preprotein translocase subunit SecD
MFLVHLRIAGQHRGQVTGVAFSLKPGADERFGQWTEKNIGNLLAVVLKWADQDGPINSESHLR